jgi:hypothetical protein
MGFKGPTGSVQHDPAGIALVQVLLEFAHYAGDKSTLQVFAEELHRFLASHVRRRGRPR